VQALLFPDIGLKTLGSNSTGAAFTWPKIVAGDDLRLKLRLTETISGEKVLSRRTLSALKLSIGRKKEKKRCQTLCNPQGCPKRVSRIITGMIGNEAQLRLAGFEKEGCRGDWRPSFCLS
jgi:hypothetical protein